MMLILTADAAIELANWDSSKVRDKLRRDIDAHVASVRAAKLSDLVAQYEVCLHRICCPVCIMSSQTEITTLKIYMFGFMNYTYDIILVIRKIKCQYGLQVHDNIINLPAETTQCGTCRTCGSSSRFSWG